MTPSDLILDRLREHGMKVFRDRSQCPVHGSRGLTLSVRPGVTDDGRSRAVVRCFASCDAVDVLAAVGLELRDLYDGNRPADYRPPVIPRSPNPPFWDRGMEQLYRETDWRRLPSWDHVLDRWTYEHDHHHGQAEEVVIAGELITRPMPPCPACRRGSTDTRGSAA